MTDKAKLALRFVVWTVCYGFAAFIVVALTSIRTCGMTSDSVELCDLIALTIIQVVLAVGYLAMAIYFYRTRVSGRV